MIVSWVTANEPGNNTVAYGEDPARMERRADGAHTRYDYFNYTSGFIHHCTLRNLKVHLFVCLSTAILPSLVYFTDGRRGWLAAARHQVLLRHGFWPHGQDLLVHHAAQAGP
jgi:hypothetical protein